MKFEKPKSVPGQGGPSSAIGIMRFFDTEAGGPKISPEFVFIGAVFFILAMIVLNFLS